MVLAVGYQESEDAMGSVSVLLIRNDNLHEIAGDVEIGNKISDAIAERHSEREVSISSGRAANAIDVPLANLDSNEIAIVVVEGNTAYWLNEHLDKDGKLPEWSEVEKTLVEIVQQLGYTVTSPAQKP